ncbi:hypothetical protein L202_01221 [Cryptococcus amylolentus CBS 6039]|uniref:Uncharacterized protein n=2 Tax=Cryptococcus amylolentus TaxID=104669 RepID=A0A1E3I3N3_9TREE|nr:hypothetical protein L202_01221 [Cryptococcus amylolentus CBS 6039]ODN82985.1 hypothetical protein L202_01221 [Cryptococcus amylolentus CBS 6039]ODO10614.1 hypothetical protein I350_01211 [Cryptococcus amylolentus CBS 6273]
MLLRLLPTPTPDNPSPLTILFTLPLPTHPYTSRSLPLPPALLSHRNLCVQENVECPNILLGECASWVAGIIDDVTFSLPLLTIAVNFVDGTSMTMPITDDCVKRLDSVVDQVQMSFATTAPSPVAGTRTSLSSAGSSSASVYNEAGNNVPRRSFLYNILSPLLPSSPQVQSQPSPCAQTVSSASARVHRRLARSILVDTYRCYVLPVLKENLPSAYLPWSIQSECNRMSAQFEKLQSEINALLAKSKSVEPRELASSRSRSTSTSSDHASSSCSDSECSSTNATSVDSLPPRATPQSYLVSLPPVHSLPSGLRTQYTFLLSRLTKIASRTSQLRKLGMRYDREDGRRAWLENLERGRLADKVVRRSWGNLELPLSMRSSYASVPQQGTRLWRSVTAKDVERERQEREARSRLMADTPYAFGEEDEDSDAASFTSEDDLPVTPTTKPTFPLIRPVMPAHTEQGCEPGRLYVSVEDCEPESPVKSRVASPPPLIHSTPNSRVVSSFNEYRASWEDNPVVGKVTSAMESLMLAGPLIKAKLAVAEEADGNGEVQMERFYGQCGLHV